MKTMNKYLVLIILLEFGHFYNGFGQHADSLMQYLQIAAKNNPSVLQKYYEYQSALTKIQQSGSLPDPELSLGIFLSPMEIISGKQVADIRLMQMFPWFGVLKNAKDEMSLMAKAKYESFRDTKLQVFYNVQLTWFEMQKVQQEIGIAEKNIGILHTIEQLTLVKFGSISSGDGVTSKVTSTQGSNMQNKTVAATVSGSMNSNMGGDQSQQSGSQSSAMQGNSMGTGATNAGLADIYRLQIEESEIENKISLLKDQLVTLKAKFNLYLNRSPRTAVILPDSIKMDSLNVSLLSISDSMLTRNPMLGMLQYEQQSIEAREKMVNRMGYPMVGLGVNYSLINKSNMSASSMNGKDMIMPMVTVTLPVYRKKYNAMQNETEMQKASVMEGLQSSSNALQTEYYQAIQLYQDAQRRVDLYRNQSRLAKKSLDIMIVNFAVSTSGLTDILVLQLQLLGYETKQIEAMTDFNTVIAWLKRLAAQNQVE